MSQNESKMVTEVEAVRRERKAFNLGVDRVFEAARRLRGIENVDGRSWVDVEYPLPKVTRPRVVVDPCQPQFEWTVKGGTLMVRNRDAIGHSASLFGRVGHEFGAFDITAERVTMWADILASPTEEVVADA